MTDITTPHIDKHWRDNFMVAMRMQDASGERIGDALATVDAHCAELDAALTPFLDRTMEEVDPIERAALRIAAYELQHRIDVPYRVVLNEAVESVKRFGSEHGHTYVNGVLDQAAGALRAIEVQASKQR